MISAGKGGCSHLIYFGKSYYLTYGKREDHQKGMVEYILENVLPDICIFNAGTHLVDPGDLYNILGIA